MAEFELNIYGQNDEIVKQFTTDKVRWGIFAQALEANESLGKKTLNEQFKLINSIVQKIFPGITDADLENADYKDVLNTFRQLVNKASGIGGNIAKNAEGAE